MYQIYLTLQSIMRERERERERDRERERLAKNIDNKQLTSCRLESLYLHILRHRGLVLSIASVWPPDSKRRDDQKH